MISSSKNFCCNDIEKTLNENSIGIAYNMVFREYYFKRKKNEVITLIWYCPWCGHKLPDSLRATFFDIIENEYGIETNIFEVLKHPNLPKEFKSDEWWKKRGL